MKKLELFTIRFSVDKNITGVSDTQVHKIDYKNETPKKLIEKYQEIYYDYLDGSLDMHVFIADQNSRPNDVLSSNFLTANGMFISNAFKLFVEQFELCNYKFIPVSIKNIGKKNVYWFLNMVPCDLVDYVSSEFVIANYTTGEEFSKITLRSQTDFIEQTDKLVSDKGFDFIIKERKVVLTKAKDIFRYELSGEKLISAKLKNEIVSNKFTGIVMEKFGGNVYLK